MATPTTATMSSAGLLGRAHEEEGILAAAPPRSKAYEITKRILDTVCVSILLALLSPLMVLAAVLIKLTSRGPVIFQQKRAGRSGKPFTMYKFRTMRVGAEEDQVFLAHHNEQDGPAFKMTNDPRLTVIGRLLRRTSIDELPQLLNVLTGKMSLVGPRPLPLQEAQKVTGQATLRTAVKPGLTCLWQISGRNELTYEERVLLDLYYIRHRSVALDLLILVRTIPAVLSCRGAY